MRLGRSCPGYRDESDLIFRLESPSSFADGASRDRRRKPASPPSQSTSRARSSGSGKSDDVAGGLSRKASRSPKRPLDPGISGSRLGMGCKLMQPDTVVFAGWYLLPSRQLSECWDTHALLLAFSNICCPQRHAAPQGLVMSLPEMISNAAADSAIVLVCRAIGNAFLTCKVGTAEAQSKRATTYGLALTATNAALEDPVLQVQDETLASVFLLSVYEVRVIPSQARRQADNLLTVDCLADRWHPSTWLRATRPRC